MVRPCPNRIVCPPGSTDPLDTDAPISNFSSEATDGPDFPSLSWPIVDPFDPFAPDDPNDPPTLCISPVSQDDADLCSTRNSNDHHNGGVPGVNSFTSGIQTCPYLCPDGTFFLQTVGPGAFIATSQSLANQQAAAYACQLAAQNVFCLSDPATACCNSPYSGKIVITGGNGPFTPEIIGGSLPPGIGISQSSDTRTIFLNGTPSAPGNFSFALSVEDGLGNFKTKTITVKVICIQGTPPTAQFGVPYSFQFSAVGGDGGPYGFKAFQPALQNGLVINPDGTLTGTPNTVGTFIFGIGVADKNGNTCGSQSKITIAGVCNQQQHGVLTCPGNPGIIASITIPAGTYCAPVGTNQDAVDAAATQNLLNQISASLRAQGCTCHGFQVDSGGVAGRISDPDCINGLQACCCNGCWVNSCQGLQTILATPLDVIGSCDTFVGNGNRPRTVTLTIPGGITVVFFAP